MAKLVQNLFKEEFLENFLKEHYIDSSYITQFDRDKLKMHGLKAKYFGYSDYGGSLIDRANIEYLLETAPNHCISYETAHYGVTLHFFDSVDRVEALESYLDSSYPLLDEDRYGELKLQLAHEALQHLKNDLPEDDPILWEDDDAILEAIEQTHGNSCDANNLDWSVSDVREYLGVPERHLQIPALAGLEDDEAAKRLHDLIVEDGGVSKNDLSTLECTLYVLDTDNYDTAGIMLFEQVFGDLLHYDLWKDIRPYFNGDEWLEDTDYLVDSFGGKTYCISLP